MKTFAVSYAAKSGSATPPANKSTIKKIGESNSGPRTILVILIIVFLVSITVRTLNQPDGLTWLFGGNGASTGEIPADIALALGPITALALAIERLIETIFDMFESNVKEIAKKTAAGEEGLNYISEITTLYTDEMFAAKDALSTALGQPNTTPAKKSTLIKAVEEAEKRLKDTGAMWDDLTKDPKYISWKRAISIWLSLVIGMIVAVFSERGFFYYLNLNVPRLLDMLITGFVLGAGSGPMHSLIGILQSAKDSLGNLGSGFTGAGAIQDEIRSLREEMQK